MRTAPAALLLVLCLAGCGSDTPGVGEPAADGGPGTTTPPAADPTSGPPPASTTPTTSAQTTVAEPSGLACAQPAVAPPAAPYCYTVPTGLSEINLGNPTAGEEGSFRTSYGFGAADHIDVQAYVVGVDTDGLADEEIISGLTDVVADLESGGFDFADVPERITVDGARGFVYPGTSSDGAQVITAHFVFRGITEVQLNCSVTERVAAIEAACDEVLTSLQLLTA